MKTALCSLLGLLLVGCNNFELKKLTSEDILQKELQHIDWSQVDVSPTFETCPSSAESCFNDVLGTAIHNHLSAKNLQRLRLEADTLYFNFKVSKLGTISLDTIKGSPLPDRTYKLLTTYAALALTTLPKSYPAQKRGIPVATAFSLPIIVVEE